MKEILNKKKDISINKSNDFLIKANETQNENIKKNSCNNFVKSFIENGKYPYKIKCSKIVSDNKLEFIEGYVFESNKATINAFNQQKKNNQKWHIGGILLDLIDSECDIIDTIIIDKEYYYNNLRKK